MNKVEAREQLVLMELLREFEGQEPDDPMILFLARPLPTAILHFWPEINTGWVQPERPYPDNPAERWEWLWEGVEYDLPKLAACIGAPEYLVRSRVSIFAAWRWILPDGTVAPKIVTALAAWRSKKPDSSQASRQQIKPN